MKLALLRLKIVTGFDLIFRDELLQELMHFVILLRVTDTLLEHYLVGTQPLAGNTIASGID